MWIFCNALAGPNCGHPHEYERKPCCSRSTLCCCWYNFSTEQRYYDTRILYWPRSFFLLLLRYGVSGYSSNFRLCRFVFCFLHSFLHGVSLPPAPWHVVFFLLPSLFAACPSCADGWIFLPIHLARNRRGVTLASYACGSGSGHRRRAREFRALVTVCMAASTPVGGTGRRICSWYHQICVLSLCAGVSKHAICDCCININCF